MARTKPKWIDATNSPSDGQSLIYDSATGKFEWADATTINGTTNSTFGIDTDADTYTKLKNNSGVLEARNQSDDGYSDIKGKKIVATGGIDAGDNGTAIKFKKINIGDWNMDSIDYVDVAHGVTASKILDVAVTIINDAADDNQGLDAVNHGDEGWIQRGSTNIRLHRTTNGHFDSADYDSTSYNRGYILVTYFV